VTVLVGTMQLPVPQDADQVRAYLNGTIADGGLWTGLTRASDHDHTGGLNGKPISVASIPNGSITTAKLDPSVLLPYALVDGSKPFTGQVALNGDAIIRNTLYFGAKPAGAADVTVARTGAGALRVDNNLGVGVNPAAWGPSYRSLHIGNVGSLAADSTAQNVILGENYYFDGTNNRALTANAAALVSVALGQVQVMTAPAVAAGATQTFKTRLTVNPAGALIVNSPGVTWGGTDTLSRISMGAGAVLTAPDNAQHFNIYTNTTYDGTNVTPVVSGSGYPTQLHMNGLQGGFVVFISNVPVNPGDITPFIQSFTVDANRSVTINNKGGTPTITNASGDIRIVSAQFVNFSALGADRWQVQHGGLYPVTDNSYVFGGGVNRATAVYAVNGAIQTSVASMKEAFAPLDPAACVQAVLETDWVSFSYLPPAYVEPTEPTEKSLARAMVEGVAGVEPMETVPWTATLEATKAGYAKMVKDTEPARHQKGYVLQSPDHKTHDLFGLSDRQSANASSDLAVVACALQDALKRIATLEGARA
jgi:hypothetical protein